MITGRHWFEKCDDKCKEIKLKVAENFPQLDMWSQKEILGKEKLKASSYIFLYILSISTGF